VPDHGGGGSEWVRLIVARHDIDAHLLSGRLNEAGVETRSVKDRGGAGAWLYGGSNPWAPVAIMVRKFQLDDARLVLAEISLDAPAHDKESEQPSGRRRVPTLWWATAIALGILFTALAFVQVARSESPCQLPIFCEETDSK
jgi:hypothetical protein